MNGLTALRRGVVAWSCCLLLCLACTEPDVGTSGSDGQAHVGDVGAVSDATDAAVADGDTELPQPTPDAQPGPDVNPDGFAFLVAEPVAMDFCVLQVGEVATQDLLL